MFNGVFDWTDESWHTSIEKVTVQPGDLLTSSVFIDPTNSKKYYMRIASKNTGKVITTPYTIERRQTADETMAYFVLEHAPNSCAAYPPDGICTFTDISIAVDNAIVT